VPPAPDGLTEEIAARWETYWRSPAATISDPVDMAAIQRLFGLYSQHQKASEVVAQGLVVKGSVGQIRVNPLADHVLKLESAILRLETELGLTPMARVRLGVELKDGEHDGQPLSIVDQLAERRAAAG
jgi:P27 family predicted phage terminase small subunit